MRIVQEEPQSFSNLLAKLSLGPRCSGVGLGGRRCQQANRGHGKAGGIEHDTCGDTKKLSYGAAYSWPAYRCKRSACLKLGISVDQLIFLEYQGNVRLKC